MTMLWCWLLLFWWIWVPFVTGYYSKMPIVCKILAFQCNAAKTVSVMKGLFAEHGIPEMVCSDNIPQTVKSWSLTTSLVHLGTQNAISRNHHENHQKGLITSAKYSGQDPFLALLAYCSMPIDAHLCLPGELLYQWALCTTVPQWIWHTDPQTSTINDHLDHHIFQSTVYRHCRGYRKRSPLFDGQVISILNDAKNMLLLATIIHEADNGSYLVQVVGRGQYWYACNHFCKHHPDAIRLDVPITRNVEPATSMLLPAIQVVRTVVPVTSMILMPAALAATPCTPHKPLPAVYSPQQMQMPSTGVTSSLTGAPQLPLTDQPEAVSHHLGLLNICRRTRIRKDIPVMPWPGTPFANCWGAAAQEVNHDDVTGLPYTTAHNGMDSVTMCTVLK